MNAFFSIFLKISYSISISNIKLALSKKKINIIKNVLNDQVQREGARRLY